jgi:hypothetical protein
MDTTQIEQRARDESHIRLLAIFSFVMAGFSTVGLLFIGGHYMIMHTVFNNPQIVAQMKEQMAQQPQTAQVDPAVFLKAFVWFYVIFGLWSLASIVANLVAGVYLLKRSGRVPAIVVGAFNCINIPLGTVLGIFTIVVLTRDSVRERFLEGAAPVTV